MTPAAPLVPDPMVIVTAVVPFRDGAPLQPARMRMQQQENMDGRVRQFMGASSLI
jgi:hypothetical protein